jgi:ABC-type uncharacterized transport system
MKPYLPRFRQQGPKLDSRERGRAGIIVLVLISFVLGLAASAFYFRGSSRQSNAQVDGRQPDGLSEGTMAVLKGLKSQVQIRFYSILDPASTSDALKTYAVRVDQLLSDYQGEAGGKIKVVRYNSMSDASADAAFADGITPFNMDKGNACYLGIAISYEGQKESLSRLLPDWEQALESDLSRAIVRVSSTIPTTKSATANALPDKAVVDEVKRAIPNLGSVSLERGTEILREAAVREFATAASQMEAQLKEAQQRLTEAQNGKSEGAQQAAMKNLQQIQAGQMDKIKQIAARLQDQIAALQRLKQE